MSKSLTKNSVYYLIYEVLNVIFPFLTGMYVARVLLPDTVGTVTYANNIAQYFVILAYLGIPTYGMREVAKVRDDKEQLNKLYSELFIINLISTITFLTIYLGMVFIVSSFRANYIIYLITGISIALNAINISFLYTGLEEFKFISIRNIIFKILFFVLLILFVHDDGDYLIYALITVVGTAGNYIINMLFSGRYVKFTRKGLSFKRHLKPVFMLVVVNLAIELYSLVDTTMIGIFCEDANVAYYSYASKIYRILLQVVNTFTMVLVPRISYYYKQGELDKYNGLISKTLNIIILLAVPMIIGVFFVADFVIVLLYTDAYITSANILKILSLNLLISPIGYLLGSRVLLASGHENKMTICVWSGAVVNIVLNAILIPIYAEIGAAVASVLSECIVMIVYVAFGRKYFKLSNIGFDIVKIIIAAISLAVVVYLMTLIPIADIWIFVLQVICGVIVFFFALLLMKEKIVYEYFKKFTRRFSHERT